MSRRFKSTIAQAMASNNPALADRHEAELILRYHQHCFERWSRSPRTQDDLIEQRGIERKSCMRHLLDVLSAEEAERHAEAIGDRDDLKIAIAAITGVMETAKLF